MIGNENSINVPTKIYQVSVVRTTKKEGEKKAIPIKPFFQFTQIISEDELTPQKIKEYDEKGYRKDSKFRYYVPVTRDYQFSGYFSNCSVGYYNEEYNIQNIRFNLFDFNPNENVVEYYWFSFNLNDAKLGKDIANTILGLQGDKKYVGKKLKLSVYEREGKGDKKGEKYPAFALNYEESNGKFEMVSWKHDPTKNELFKPKMVKVGKRDVPDFQELYDFLLEDLKSFSFERKNLVDVVPSSLLNDTNTSQSSYSDDFEDTSSSNSDDDQVEGQLPEEADPVEEPSDDLPF